MFSRPYQRLKLKITKWLQEIDPSARVYYGQFGEDACIQSYYRGKAFRAHGDLLKMETGFYVDVGAYSPKNLSNTYWFYKQGWRGINIEASPSAKEMFDSVRPRDINVEAAISNQEKELHFFTWGIPCVYNTLCPGKAGIFTKQLGREPDKIKVSTKKLSTILDQHLPENQSISFLSVDSEGHDLEVLQSNNWSKYRPELIVSEEYNTSVEELIESEITNFLSDQGYSLQYWIPPSNIYLRIS